MPKAAWCRAALVCLLAVLMMGAGDAGNRYGRVGHNLMCVCGCGQVLLECNHVGCPDSNRMIGELKDQINGPNGGGADSLILNWFVAKYGATVLAAPIRGGFDNVAWAIPVALFLFATLGTGLVIRRWMARREPEAAVLGPASHVDPALLERIRRETEY